MCCNMCNGGMSYTCKNGTSSFSDQQIHVHLRKIRAFRKAETGCKVLFLRTCNNNTSLPDKKRL